MRPNSQDSDPSDCEATPTKEASLWELNDYVFHIKKPNHKRGSSMFSCAWNDGDYHP